MTAVDRREFLKRSKQTSLGIAAGVTILQSAASVTAAPANEKVVLAAVGVGGRGRHLALSEFGFLARGDCEYAYACDVDVKKAGGVAPQFAEKQGGRAPKVEQDFRRALEDKSVDAIISATPDHWHAPSTVWACQAGKDVYVEKPACHSCWEGRKMVEAARKYGRIVQIGTQNRSAPCNMSAKKYIDEGKLGEIYMCRIYNQKNWGNRPVVPDSDPPEGLDWDMWNGPAPAHAYNQTLHRGWHHIWNYSGGDIANDASHQIDLARWLCGLDYPQTVYSTGGRYATEGAFETPDTQVAVYQFPKMVVTFELTLYTPYMLKTDMELRQSDMVPYWPQNATRIELYGTKGLMYVGRHGGGWQVFDRPKSRRPVVKEEVYGRFPDREHKENFIQSLRSRELPSADVEHGHLSALMIHYGNISYRTGHKLTIDPKTEGIVNDPEAMKLFKRTYREGYAIPEEV